MAVNSTTIYIIFKFKQLKFIDFIEKHEKEYGNNEVNISREERLA